MNGATHLAAGVLVAVAIARVDQQPIVMAAALVGALLPDIDHPRAMIIGYLPVFGIVRWAAGIHHRGITHTVWFTVLAFVGMWVVLPAAALAFTAGIASHLVLDMITPAGVRLFYPLFRYSFGWLWVIVPLAIVGFITLRS